MNLSAIIVELCTSAPIRPWRWLFSARYRAAMRLEHGIRGKAATMAWVLETLIFVTAEVVAVILILDWLFKK